MSAFERSSQGDFARLDLADGGEIAIDGGDIFVCGVEEYGTNRVSPTAAELRLIAAELLRFADKKEGV